MLWLPLPRCYYRRQRVARLASHDAPRAALFAVTGIFDSRCAGALNDAAAARRVTRSL